MTKVEEALAVIDSREVGTPLYQDAAELVASALRECQREVMGQKDLCGCRKYRPAKKRRRGR